MPYADTGGISLHYEDTGPDHPSPAAPALLLLHELGGSAESWRTVTSLLAPRRRVIAMDYRCAGRSEKPPGSFALEALADDAAALLTHLRIARADVIGAALGSLAGILLAGRHPARVRRLAIFAVSDDLGGRTAAYLSERAARVRAEGMRPVADASLANAFPEMFAAARAAYRPLYLGHDPAGYAALSLALSEARFGDAAWAAVKAPTLVASGAHDFIWPPDHGRAMAARIAGARFEILAEAGHFPHLQTPAALVSMAERFFSG